MNYLIRLSTDLYRSVYHFTLRYERWVPARWVVEGKLLLLFYPFYLGLVMIVLAVYYRLFGTPHPHSVLIGVLTTGSCVGLLKYTIFAKIDVSAITSQYQLSRYKPISCLLFLAKSLVFLGLCALGSYGIRHLP